VPPAPLALFGDHSANTGASEGARKRKLSGHRLWLSILR
jgi:hypothetical protein